MRRAPLALVLAGVLVLAGCAGAPPRPGHPPDPVPPVPCLPLADDGLFLTCLRTELDEVWSPLFRATGRAYTSPELSVGRPVAPPSTPAGDDGDDRDRAYFNPRTGIHFPTRYLDDVRAAHGPRAHTVLAFTVSHETGHHVQRLLHPHRDAPQVDVETQADCYAGVWAHREALVRRLDPAGFSAAAAAELRRLSGLPGEVDSHGDADRRIAALGTGLRTGDPAACDVGALTWR